MSANNVVCLLSRQPYVAPRIIPIGLPEPMRAPCDYLAAYAEVAQDDARAAAGLMTPALGVARKSKEDLHRMVAGNVRDAIDTLSAFHDAAITARILFEALQAAEAKLSLAIHSVTYQHITGA